MRIVNCSVCHLDKKHHAKGMCKSCYCKSDDYKQLRKPIDKRFQSENKIKIYDVRKKRRTSEKFKQSDCYVKNLIASNFGLKMVQISKYPYLVKSKRAELKIIKIIKTLNENEKDK